MGVAGAVAGVAAERRVQGEMCGPEVQPDCSGCGRGRACDDVGHGFAEPSERGGVRDRGVEQAVHRLVPLDPVDDVNGVAEDAGRGLIEVALECAENLKEQMEIEAAGSAESLEQSVSGDLGRRHCGLRLGGGPKIGPSLVTLADEVVQVRMLLDELAVAAEQTRPAFCDCRPARLAVFLAPPSRAGAVMIRSSGRLTLTLRSDAHVASGSCALASVTRCRGSELLSPLAVRMWRVNESRVSRWPGRTVNGKLRYRSVGVIPSPSRVPTSTWSSSSRARSGRTGLFCFLLLRTRPCAASGAPASAVSEARGEVTCGLTDLVHVQDCPQPRTHSTAACRVRRD